MRIRSIKAAKPAHTPAGISTKVVTERLTDGSKVYDLILSADGETVRFNCENERTAHALHTALNGIVGFTVRS